MGCSYKDVNSKEEELPYQEDCEEDEKPSRQVNVSAFEISKYEVTQEQWEAVMGKNPSRYKDCSQCPVEKVSWEDIENFLLKLNKKAGNGDRGYRLPTEAEWEYAARGGEYQERYKYAGDNDPKNVAWYKDNSMDKTHPVGEKKPNELGLYDMNGNVREWVQDCWNESYKSAPSNGQAWETGTCSKRVLRGGSWTSEPKYLRSTNRASDSTGNLRDNNGFRIARSLP